MSMNTQFLQASPESIALGAELIRRGEVVGFPTETVYGLGADALNKDAVAKIFKAKGRPGDNPLIVHVATLDMIPALIDGEMPEAARLLADAIWPGPLTMIMKKSALVPAEVTACHDTVGIRMPADQVARELIIKSGCPIAAPSANLSGKPSPTTALHVLRDMDGRVPLIIDGGASGVGLESTVVDMTKYPPVVLRPGGVTPEMIARICGEVELDDRLLKPLGEGEAPSSPGMKYLHYAPEGELTIITGDKDSVAAQICIMYDEAISRGYDCRILALDSHMQLYGARQTTSLGANETEAATRLFGTLREMDDLGAEVILSEGFTAEGVGLALMNRLMRAAAFRILEAGSK